MRVAPAVAAAGVLVTIAACGGSGSQKPPDKSPHKPVPNPMFFGKGAGYHPAPFGSEVKAGRPFGPFACVHPARPTRFLAHVEVIANGRVAITPAGIGVAPPQGRRGGYVLDGRCEYDLRTHEPTGLIEVSADRPVTVGDLFRIWGQPLSPTRLLGFAAEPRGRVVAFVGRTRWRGGDPRSIPLRRHAAVTLEIGQLVPPRRTYAFPRNL